MKLNSITNFITLAFCVLSLNTFAQLNTPRGSQRASVSQRVGITDITINYSRPIVNGREIWGKLVPYGMNNLGFGTAKAAPWRAGADENTTITFTDNVMVEGKPIQGGTYGFFVEVKPDNKATIILSKDANAWGSFFYDKNNDVLRADVVTNDVPHKELLTYEFNTVTPTSASVSLIWDKKEIPFTIEVPVSNIVLNSIREELKGQTGFLRQNWEQAANYALNNGGDLNEALGWINAAIEGQFFSQKTFNNLAIKGQILNKQGKSLEYAMLMDEASEMANKNQLNTLGYQMLNAKDYERALKCFKTNIKNNPKDPNGYDSLGEAYKIMGDKQKAIKYLKKALSLNPPANVKANSEKLLGELNAL
ncbi:DUF2911 domain-containing protein [Yeosuana marina]|uniref:DUF2911 domain-containing protein n=1 Tax=Yeosuana marina TaxID=1565536 RepID=UPI0014208305|nr:DUF2911 domain-containing protein [Yeosuana marina]